MVAQSKSARTRTIIAGPASLFVQITIVGRSPASGSFSAGGRQASRAILSNVDVCFFQGALAMLRALTTGFVMLVLASPTSAQEGKAFELGVDGMIAYRATTPSSTTVTLPVGRMRVGYFLAPNFSFEPSLSYNSSDGNGSHASRTTIGVSIVPQFATMGNAKVYARPFVDYNFVTSTVDNRRITSRSSSVGAGIGVRVPLASRLMWRLEAAYANSTGESQFMGLIGLSFFTN